MSNNKKAFKSGIWYTLSNFLVKSVGFITTPIFTRLLTHEEYGAYNNYTSWLSIVTIFVTLNLESTLISARYDYEDEFDSYIFSILSLSTMCTFVWVLVTSVFNEKFSAFLGMESIYIKAMLLYLLFLPAINLFQARERYLFEYKKTVVTSITLAMSTALISVVLVKCMTNSLTGRILGAIIPTVIIGFFLYIFFIIKGKKIKISYWKYAMPICLPYIPHLLSMTMLNSTDRVMITRFCGNEQTALYSLAYNCGTLVTLLMTSLNSAYAPWLGEKLSKNEYAEIRQFSKKYIFGFGFLAIGIMLVSPEVLLVLGGKSYIEAIYVLAPVAMGCVCQFLYTLFVNVEQFKKKTIGMAIASILAAVINIALNYIFIPKFGYVAAAYTTLVGYMCLLAMHMLMVHRIKLSEVYDNRIVIGTAFIGTVLMIMISLSYSTNYFRYFIIIIYVIVFISIVYKNKEPIAAFVKLKQHK